ncbi:unnamed protein product [Dicrocoelium dendriticum]|nr:unnamed protein product [Dicrocoelium dendriticum]
MVENVTLNAKALPIRLNFRRADYDAIKDFLSRVDWSLAAQTPTVEDHWNYIAAHIHDAISAHVPTVRAYAPKRHRQLQPATLRLIREKKAFWDRFLLFGDSDSQAQYCRVRNSCIAAVRQDRKAYKLSLAKSFADNPKVFFKHIASLTKSRAAVGSLLRPVGNTTTSDKEAAELLKTQYESVFGTFARSTMEGANFTPIAARHPVQFTSEKVLEKLKKLRTDKSPGLDGIPLIFLRECATVLAEPLASLYSRSYTSAEYLNAWKQGVITPIDKGGDRTNPSNYRPIALLPTASKVMESIIDDFLRCHSESLSLIAPEQHGFRRAHSCTTNLLAALDSWTAEADNHTPTDVVYVDFSKAFDRVNHALLLSKLPSLGIDQQTICWLSTYLSGRTYRVRVNGALSSALAATTGVPQGSILGPLLFNLFINDLPSCISSHILLYADDAKIWRPIRRPSDQALLQTDIDAAYSWASKNSLPFNIDKCKVMHIGQGVANPYNIGGVHLKATSQERDLGTIISADLSPSANVATLARKASVRLALLGRALGSFPRETFVRLYSTLVRPLLEYNILVQPPYLKKDEAMLETVQRRATKRVDGLSHFLYEEHLAALNLFPLKYRRLRGDLILAHSVLTNNRHPNAGLLVRARTDHLRGHSLKLMTRSSRLLCRRNSFSVRIAFAWNALPEVVVSAPNTEAYQQRLDAWLLPSWSSTLLRSGHLPSEHAALLSFCFYPTLPNLPTPLSCSRYPRSHSQLAEYLC